MKNPKGIGGWLMVPLLMFIVYGLFYIYDVIINFGLIMRQSYSQIVVILEIGIALLNVFTVILIFRKKKSAPRMSIVTIWIVAIYGLIASFALDTFTFGSIWGAIIWTLYFTKSNRVRNTFTK